MKTIFALVCCLLLAIHGLRKKSLNLNGALAAFCLGLIIFTHSQFSFAGILLVFYLSSSALTKLGSNYKKKLEYDHKEG
jgi:uncharacterized membrane protein